MEFLNTLMQTIIDGKDTPKAQVERYISPILEIFVAKAIGRIVGKEIELVSAEFPIKKGDSYQSTNIDFLLASNDEIVFLELKTDSTSGNASQMSIYEELTGCDCIGEKLVCDFNDIMNHSSKKVKYKKVYEKIAPKLERIKKLDKLSIIYLVPKNLKEKSSFCIDKKTVITFGELDANNEIEHSFADEWKIITSYLKTLDDN